MKFLSKLLLELPNKLSIKLPRLSWQIILLLTALLLSAGAASPVYNTEPDAQPTGVITAIEYPTAAPVTVWTNDLEPLHQTMVKFIFVSAQAVDRQGVAQTLRLRVRWNAKQTFEQPGEYTVSAPIVLPTGFVLADDLPPEATLRVKVLPARQPDELIIVGFEDFSHRLAYSLPLGADWESFFNSLFYDGLWENTLLCYATDGSEHVGGIRWQNPQADTSRPGLITLRGQAVPPANNSLNNYTLAQGLEPPLVELSVSVQKASQPRLDCWYVADACLILPWQGAEVAESAQLMLNINNGGWQPAPAQAFRNEDAVYLPLHILQTGSAYQLKAVWPGGETGVFSFEWNGHIDNSNYIGGDRDGGDVSGNPPITVIQPPPAADDGDNSSDDDSQSKHPSKSSPRTRKPDQNDSKVNSQTSPAFLEQSGETYSLLSGARLQLMREGGAVRIAKQGVAVTFADEALDALNIQPTSQIYIEIKRQAAGFSLAVELDGQPIHNLPDTLVQLPYALNHPQNSLELLDGAGNFVCQGVCHVNPATAGFVIPTTGQYTLSEIVPTASQSTNVSLPNKTELNPAANQTINILPLDKPELNPASAVGAPASPAIKLAKTLPQLIIRLVCRLLYQLF